jgi:hypothetical protein
MVFVMDCFNGVLEFLGLFAALAFWSLCPSIIPADRCAKHTTLLSDSEGISVTRNEAVLHCFVLENTAKVFLRFHALP